MSYYGEKEKFPVSGLTSGLTTINRKNMTLPTQGRTLWTAKIVLPREVAEKRGEYTEKLSIDMKKPRFGAGKQPIEEALAGLKLTRPTYANKMKLYNEFSDVEVFGRALVMKVCRRRREVVDDEPRFQIQYG